MRDLAIPSALAHIGLADHGADQQKRRALPIVSSDCHLSPIGSFQQESVISGKDPRRDNTGQASEVRNLKEEIEINEAFLRRCSHRHAPGQKIRRIETVADILTDGSLYKKVVWPGSSTPLSSLLDIL